jgi:hypothetical protein
MLDTPFRALALAMSLIPDRPRRSWSRRRLFLIGPPRRYGRGAPCYSYPWASRFLRAPHLAEKLRMTGRPTGRSRDTIERIDMSQQVLFKLELPEDLERFRLPRGVDERLQGLLDRQDRGEELTPDERREAEGLVDLAELLSLLKLRAQRA